MRNVTHVKNDFSSRAFSFASIRGSFHSEEVELRSSHPRRTRDQGRIDGEVRPG
jgi:hypothetical protein